MNDRIVKNNPSDCGVPRLALRVREAAEAMGICERTLSTWTKAGGIPHVRRGHVILYPVSVIDAWLRSETTPNEPEMINPLPSGAI